MGFFLTDRTACLLPISPAILPHAVSSKVLRLTATVSMNIFMLSSLNRCPGDFTGVAADSSTTHNRHESPPTGDPKLQPEFTPGIRRTTDLLRVRCPAPDCGQSPRARLREASDGHLEDGVAKPITDTGAPHQGTLCCRHVLDGAQSRLPCWDDTMSTRAGQY